MADLGTFTWPGSAGGSSGSNASVGLNGSTAPTSSTEVAGVNPTGNLQPLQTNAAGSLITVPDPAGVQHVIVDSSALPTGAATQTTLASMLANMTNGSQITQITGTVPLPTGASTSALQTTGNTSLATIATNTPTLGQAVMASSSPVVIASNQSAIPTTDNTLDVYVTGAGPATAVINSNILLAVTGTGSTDMQGARAISFQVNTGASTTAVAVNFEASNDNVTFVAVGMYDKTTPTAAPVTTFTTAASTNRYFEGPTEFRYFRVRLVAAITAGTIQTFSIQRASSYIMTNNSLAAGTQVIGSLAANQSSNVAQINAVAPLMGNGVTGTGSLRVTLASDTSSNTNAFLTGEVAAASSAVTSVASSATTVSLLASNAARKNAAFFNESTAILYLKLGATASLTSYTVQIPSQGYYELPTGKIYSGAIDGIWSAANGSARITELT